MRTSYAFTRVAAGTSSDFVSPTSGWMRSPSTVSSAHLVRYSCARWIGLRVWKPTTRFQPRSAKSARVSRGSLCSSGNDGSEPLEDRHRAGDVVVRLAVEPRDARMSVVGRSEAALRLALLVVVVDLLDLEDGERPAALVGEGDPVSARLVLDGEADRERPRKAAREAHVLDHALVVGRRHEARQRRERSRGEHVQVGQLARRERDGLERLDVARPLARALDELAAVRLDQLIGGHGAHAFTSGGQEPDLLELGDDGLSAFLRRLALGVDDDLRVLGLLIGVVDAGEALDLAGEGLFVEALHVAARALLDGGADEDLDERALLLDQLARLSPRLLVRGDGRADDGGAVADEPRGDPADALDVRVAILLRESETLGQARAHRVAVEVLDDRAALVELGADEVRDRRLPGAGETREPEAETASARLTRLGVLVAVDVFRHAFLSSR